MQTVLNVFTDIINIVEDPLIFLKIIPDKSIQKNGRKIEQIVDSLYQIYKPFFQRIQFRKGGIIYKKPDYATYAIFYTEKSIEFILGIPSMWENFITQRIYSVFPNCTVQSCNDYLEEFELEKTIEVNFGQKEHFFKSIATDYRENAPISSLLSVHKDISKNDKLLFEIILKPLDGYWKEEAERVRKKYLNGELEEQSDGIIDFIFKKLLKIIDIFFSAIDLILELNIENKDNDINKRINRSDLNFNSNQKIAYNGFQSQIRVLSQSNDSIKREMNAKSIEIALSDISGDNELIIKKIKKDLKAINRKQNPLLAKINGKIIFSSKEIGQFFQMPTAHLQEEYPVVESIDTREIELPKQLFQNGIIIGETKYKGIIKKVSWNTKDRDVATLPKTIFGMQGSGKTEYQANFAIDALNKKHSVFVLDGIKNCELSTKIRNYAPIEKIIELDFGNAEFTIPLFWNEVRYKIQEANNTMEKFQIANHVTKQLMLFLDSFVDETTQKLTPRMKRYLNAAGLIAFSQINTTMLDVLKILTDYDVRHNFIKNSGLSDKSKVVKDLKMLDDVKTEGTKINEVKGIIDRLDILLGDYVLSAIFSTKSKKELDFIKFMNEGYLVLCKMPQINLSDGTIDTLITFLMSKIWLAAIMRGDNKRITHVIVDEIHRYPTAVKILDNIREMRKYNLSYFFSAHQPQDFKKLLPTLKSAGSSYMLLNTSIDNLKYFEQEIKPFTIEECLETKKYHAKCIINYDKEYCVFDAKMPLPIQQTYKYKNREYIKDNCIKEYGVKIYL
jgi:predicted transcriptional regulator